MLRERCFVATAFLSMATPPGPPLPSSRPSSRPLSFLLPLPLLLLLLLSSPRADAGCPNACSGHGHCGYGTSGKGAKAQVMCLCYKSWEGSDCSLRSCPWGYAFLMTPRGDLNLDGDRYVRRRSRATY